MDLPSLDTRSSISFPVPVPVPVVETERLVLRGHTVADMALCCELWGDPEVTRFIGGKPFTEEEVWSRLLRYAGHWSLLGFGYWLVEERATGAFVGEVGLSNYRRELVPPLCDVPEVGWVLSPAQHGKGYATEAVQATLRWGRECLEAEEFACIIAPGNTASLRVAERCGFQQRLVTSYKGSPTILLTCEG
jgi:RimJ/RimL family protein N-acetyltransferase